MNTKLFLTAYVSEITSNLLNFFGDENFDFNRYVKRKEETPKITPKSIIIKFLNKKNYINLSLFSRIVINAIEFIEPFLPRFDALYQQLHDDDSRNILIKILAYRALGYKKVKLPLNMPEYWAGIERVKALADPSNNIPFTFVALEYKSKLLLFDLQMINIPITLYSTPFSIYNEFIAEQYKCISDQTKIGVEVGDTVIDVGGCWGGTSLYSAHYTGDEGKVFTFEFAPGNLDVFSRNLDLNPLLKERIKIIDRAAWSSSNLRLNFEENGPGTRVIPDNIDNTGGVETLSIDDLVESKGISRVDFIKMDIEGSELKALQGALNTIKRDRPKMAICIYHRLVDFVDIPEFILSLNLGYSFYIRHYTIYDEETILYAKVT